MNVWGEWNKYTIYILSRVFYQKSDTCKCAKIHFSKRLAVRKQIKYTGNLRSFIPFISLCFHWLQFIKPYTNRCNFFPPSILIKHSNMLLLVMFNCLSKKNFWSQSRIKLEIDLNIIKQFNCILIRHENRRRWT